MKELISEEQANWIILGLSIAIVLGGLGFGFFRSASSTDKKAHWARAVLVTVVGLAVWGFWNVYNSIENYYGLDSLKALGINFLIAVFLGVLFFGLFALVPRWVSQTKAGNPGR